MVILEYFYSLLILTVIRNINFLNSNCNLTTICSFLSYSGCSCPVGWGCRIHQLHLCRGVRPPNECPGYDTKQSDGEVPVMLELWGMQSTHSLLSLPGPLWPRVVAPDKVLSMG